MSSLSRPGRVATAGRRDGLLSRAALLLDLIAVLVFVAIGRSVHAHGLSIGGLASTAWPFVTGLGAGWAVLWLWHRSPRSCLGGALVCLVTVVVGMLLRVVAGQGTAAAFIVVALVFLGATMCGWRLVVSFLGTRRPS
jgi:Protein of unknown function (DUF3054)